MQIGDTEVSFVTTDMDLNQNGRSEFFKYSIKSTVGIKIYSLNIIVQYRTNTELK